MSKILSYKCPSCGGTVLFDSDHIATYCTFCKAHFPDLTNFVLKAAELELDKTQHAMEMETADKEIRKEQIKASKSKISDISELITTCVVIGSVLLILLFCFILIKS